MIIETKRLILRPWRESDAEALYSYAADPQVGPAAGWAVHTSVEDSRRVIREILAVPGTFAVTLRNRGDTPVGSLGYSPCGEPEAEGRPELGYWIARPFWGQGCIPEAVDGVLAHLFRRENQPQVWCAHFTGNEKSRRVIEKCGFTYRFTRETGPWPAGGTRETRFYSLMKEEWECRNI